MNTNCKNCGSVNITKNGQVRNKQRFRCKSCGSNFVIGDEREKIRPEGRILAVLLYSSGKLSLDFISKYFSVSKPVVLKWKRKISQRFTKSAVGEIKEMEIDEVLHFINDKNKNCARDESWLVLETKPSDDLQAIVLLKPLKIVTKK